MNIAALLPTLHRPEGLCRVIQSLRDTAPSVHIVVAADTDDNEAHAIAREFRVQLTLCPRRRRGCAYAWNTALAAYPNADAYVLASDDVTFLPGWLEATLAKLDEIGGSGLVGLKSKPLGIQTLSAFYLMTRDFIVNHHGGVAAVPHYTAWFVDAEACGRAQKAKCYTKTEQVFVRHDRPMDKTSDLTRSRIEANKQLYQERKRQGWPDDFERIIT